MSPCKETPCLSSLGIMTMLYDIVCSIFVLKMEQPKALWQKAFRCFDSARVICCPSIWNRNQCCHTTLVYRGFTIYSNCFTQKAVKRPWLRGYAIRKCERFHTVLEFSMTCAFCSIFDEISDFQSGKRQTCTTVLYTCFFLFIFLIENLDFLLKNKKGI